MHNYIKGISSKETSFPNLFQTCSRFQGILICKPDVFRGGSRISTTSKMEFSMKTINSLKL